MSFVCHSYALVCHLHVTLIYSYATRIALVCTRMSVIHHPYVLVCYSYASCMCSYVICMSLVCVFTINGKNAVIVSFRKGCWLIPCSFTLFQMVKIFCMCVNFAEIHWISDLLAEKLSLNPFKTLKSTSIKVLFS